MTFPYFIAHTASYSPRLNVLESAVENYSLLFDLWVIYLNDIENIPSFLKKENIRVILGKDALGDIKDLAKFYLAERVVEGETHFMLDDDLVLPQDFVPRMEKALNCYNRQAVIGTYGGNFNRLPLLDYNKDRTYLGTNNCTISENSIVQWLGSGIIAYDPKIFRPRLNDAPEHHMGDIWLSVKAWKENIPLVLIQQELDWVRFNPLSTQTPSVFEMTATPKSKYFASVLNKNIHLCPLPTLLTQTEHNYIISSPLNVLNETKPIEAATFTRKVEWKRNLPKEPLVSLIVTVFNKARYLSQAIESILDQSYRNFEIVLVDDGSTDGSRDIIRRYVDSDTRIVGTFNEQRLGPGGASNVGLVMAKGDLLARLDADDIALPGRLATQVAAFIADPELVFLSGVSICLDDKGSVGQIINQPLPDSELPAVLLSQNPVIHSTLMVRPLYIEGKQIAYPEWKSAIDYGYYCAYLLSGGHMRQIAEALTLFRKGTGGITDSRLPEQNRNATAVREFLHQNWPLNISEYREIALQSVPYLLSSEEHSMGIFLRRLLREIPVKEWSKVTVTKDDIWRILSKPTPYRIPLLLILSRYGSSQTRLLLLEYGVEFLLRRCGINVVSQ